MRWQGLLLTFFLLTLSVSNFIIEDYVYQISAHNFDKFVREHKSYGRLVEFFTPWCDHCKRLAPHYSRAAKIMKTRSENFVLASIDCSQEENKKLAQKWQVQGYPGLFFYPPRAEEAQKYTGPREAYAIVDYLLTTVFENNVIFSIHDLQQMRQKYPKTSLTVGVFKEESNQSNIFMEFHPHFMLQTRYGNMIGKSSEPLFNQLEILDNDSIVLFRPYMITRNSLEKDAVVSKADFDNVTQLEEHIINTVMQECPMLDNGMNGWMQSTHKPLGVYLGDDIDTNKFQKQIAYIYNRLNKAAQYYHMKMAVAAKDDYVEYFYQMDKSQQANMFIIFQGEYQYYMDGLLYQNKKLDMDKLQTFLSDFSNNKIKYWIQSEDVPENETENNVKVLVGSTIDEFLTQNKKKNVFIMFHADWCDHCKEVLPTIEELATNNTNKNLVIAKLNKPENTVPPQFQVESYPTFYYIPANKKPILYEGERNITDFQDFVMEKHKGKKKEL